MERLNVELADRSYPISIGSGLLAQRDLFTQAIRGRRVMIVTNETVAPLYLQRLQQTLDGYQLDACVLPDGEAYKTLDSFGFRDVDFIKCDAEGYEENIMRGAEQTIRQWRPVIIVEQKRTMATRFGLQPMGAVDFLNSLGYVVAQDIGGDFLCVMPK